MSNGLSEPLWLDGRLTALCSGNRLTVAMISKHRTRTRLVDAIDGVCFSAWPNAEPTPTAEDALARFTTWQDEG